MSDLERYKLTFHAGEFIDLNFTCTESQMTSISSYLSGLFPVKKRIISGIKIESNSFAYRYNYAFAFTGYVDSVPQYTRLMGYHLISKHVHRSATQETARQQEISNYLSLHESSENASYMNDLKLNSKPEYSYHYYVSNDPDQAMRFDSFIERNTGVLTSACGLLKRKGRVDIFESETNDSTVLAMTDPVKLTLLGENGEGGQLCIEDNQLSSLETYLDSQNIEITSQVNLFD